MDVSNLRGSSLAESRPDRKGGETPHFSLADGLEVVEGDSLLLEEMARNFLRYAPTLLEGARQGVETGDILQVSRNLLDLEERAASLGALAIQERARLVREALPAGGLSGGSALQAFPDLLQAFRTSLEEVDWEDLRDRF